MTATGYLLCDGCDCRTATIPADDAAFDWPCCEHFDGNMAPCRYAVIARCTSRVTIDVVDCLSDTYTWVLLWAVTELRKSCYVGCEWAFRPYCAATPNTDDYTGMLLDVTPNALNPAFPPAALTNGVLTYHDADYRPDDAPCTAPNTCFGDFDPDCVNSLDDRWTLTAGGVAAGNVTFTLTDPDIVAWASGEGKTVPVYTSMNEWIPFGRNRMDITAGYSDFPMLPKSICVVALDDAGADDNPCDDQDSRCACNDFNIGNSATLIVNITGCDSISGLQGVTVQRTCPPEVLPCGITYPASSPCCIFLGSLSTGAGCSNVDGDWSGDVRIMVYCDPSAGEAERYKMKVYCYDTALACYVEQSVTVNLVVLLCWGSFYIEFTIADLECCCPDVVTTECCDTDVPAALTVSDGTNSVTITYSGGSWIYMPTPGSTFAGCTFTSGAGRSIALSCFGGGTWYFAIDDGGGGLPVTCNPTGTCDPVDLTCTITGCDSNTYTITITE